MPKSIDLNECSSITGCGGLRTLVADDARALVGGCSSLIDGVSADNIDSPFRMAGASRCPVRCVVSVEDVHGSCVVSIFMVF